MVSSLQITRTWVLVAILLASASHVKAWASTPAPFNANGRRNQQQLPIPQSNEASVSREQALTSHNMLREFGFMGVSQQDVSGRKKSISFSHSVLARDDACTSVPVAHGMLSPQTVVRLEELTRLRRHRSPALDTFLDTYYTNGPMSCVPMLSDPDVLPHLTMAMRDIAR
jgi:hypothetical protein